MITCGICGYSLVSGVRYIVDRLNGRLSINSIKTNEILDDLLAVSYYFDDLSKSEMSLLHDEIDLMNSKLFISATFNEKTLSDFQHYLSSSNLLDESDRETMREIISISLETIKEKSYGLNFDLLYELLLAHEKTIQKISKRRMKHAQSRSRKNI